MTAEEKKERDRAHSRAYRARNPDKIAAYNRSPKARAAIKRWGENNRARKNETRNKWRAEHPDIVKRQKREQRLRHINERRQYEKEYRERVKDRDRLKRLVRAAQGRAKKAGLPFNLDVSDIHIPDVCPVLGIELRFGDGARAPTPASPSLDRLIPSLGYVRGNVRVISHRANTIKGDATIAEMAAVIGYMERELGPQPIHGIVA